MLKSKVLSPVRPNAGIEAAYRQKLDALITEMHKSLVYWLTAAYKANKPEIAQDVFHVELANDSSPAWMMREIMRKLSRRWMRNFDKAAPELAKYFAIKATDRADGAL